VLFVELTRLGDVLAMLPALSAFRLRYPGATLSVAVDRRNAPVFEFLPMVDQVLALERTDTIPGFLEARKRLSAGSYDLICSMSPASRNSLLTLSTTSRGKIGYFTSLDLKDQFTRETHVSAVRCTMAARGSFKGNIYDRADAICASLGFAGNARVPWSVDKDHSWDRSGPRHAEPQRRVIIHPFAGWRFRCWAPDRFGLLAEEIARRHDARVVCIGTKDEVNTLAGRADIFDTTDVGQLVRLISGADLFIGNDSGPLHLASLLGIPTIGLYGPASPELTGNRGAGAVHVYHNVECSPCNQTRCIRPEDPCIDLITLEEVLRSVDGFFLRRQAAPDA
jgi:heptosyltransferase-2